MGRAKAWLTLGGAPLLAQVAARVRPLVGEIVVVAAPGQALPSLPAVGRRRVRVVRDRVSGLGPLPAVARGLAAVRSPLAFVVACDAPFVRPALLAMLLAAAPGADAVIPRWAGRPQPLVALYRRRFGRRLAALARRGERRLHVVTALPRVRVLPAATLRAADPGGASFRALNTPAEYRAARRAWRTEAMEGLTIAASRARAPARRARRRVRARHASH